MNSWSKRERAAWTSKEELVTPPLLVEESLNKMTPELSNFFLKTLVVLPCAFGKEQIGAFDNVLEPGSAVILVHFVYVLQIDAFWSAAAGDEEVALDVLVEVEVVPESEATLDHSAVGQLVVLVRNEHQVAVGGKGPVEALNHPPGLRQLHQSLPFDSFGVEKHSTSVDYSDYLLFTH